MAYDGEGAVKGEDGEEIVGTGGCRKVRFSIRGKSEGVRTITFFSAADLPVILLTVFGKSQKVIHLPIQ